MIKTFLFVDNKNVQNFTSYFTSYFTPYFTVYVILYNTMSRCLNSIQQSVCPRIHSYIIMKKYICLLTKHTKKIKILIYVNVDLLW